MPKQTRLSQRMFGSKKLVFLFAASNASDGVQFTLRRERPNAGLRVVNADLYVLVRYKKKRSKVKPSRGKRTPKRVTIKILNAPPDKVAPDFMTSLRVNVKHTRWQKLLLPTSVIQDVLDSEDKVLRLKIQCDDCGFEVNPVLVKRQPRAGGGGGRRGRAKRRQGQADQAPGAGRQSRRGSRRSSRNSQSKRGVRPLRGLQVRSAGSATSDLGRNARARSSRVFGDIRDQVQKQKVHKRRPFLVIRTRVSQHEAPMRKRSTSRKGNACDASNAVETSGSDSVRACAKKPLYVDFAEIGWNDWILYPKGYHANYCTGQCQDLIAVKAQQTTLLDSLMSSFHVPKGMPNTDTEHKNTCCVPTQYSPLSILYYDGYNIIKADIPDMKVDKCGCI